MLPAASRAAALPAPAKGETLVLLGNTLPERMRHFGHFETELHRRFPTANLTLRNMGHPGDTPVFRPRAGQPDQWAFPGGKRLRPEFISHHGKGHYPKPDQWLTTVGADTIIAFYGFNESFDGVKQADKFRAELDAFVVHTLAQKYNGKSTPKLVLVTPVAFEDRSDAYDLPNGKEENIRLSAYAKVVREVAANHALPSIDLFTPTQKLFAEKGSHYTINGCHLSDAGYAELAPLLADALYGKKPATSKADTATLYSAVNDKAWFWFNDFRMLNGVHVYGRRHKPYGNVNYPEEIEKIRQMTRLRDEKIWALASGKTNDLTVDDNSTRSLTPVKTNFKKPITYLDSQEAKKKFTLPKGYEINLFASEEQFPELGNPVQMSFDGKGRLWVSTIRVYPHYLPGDEKPNDRILIYEDTDGDGKADTQTIFADGLHLPIGFELAPEGVYVSQEPDLVLLRDTDGDDRADTREVILSGFDSHDTHHAISAYTADASGAFYMSEGRFLHSQVETPYGPVRSNDGGIYRFDPRSWRLERFSQADYSNPWGVSFDKWGQNFVSDASGGHNYWLLPLSARVPYGYEQTKENQFTTHRVRPTAGTEFVYSQHFPDEVQGDFLLNNTIGFLGTKDHSVREDGAGYTGELRQNLVESSDPNYRPSDLEFAPDGSLYITDWHNALVGHMQHSARDPNRNSKYGRIYRVTYPDRPLVKAPRIAGATIPQLLENLKHPDYRIRYRTWRELRGHPASKIVPATRAWAASLNPKHPDFERYRLEALWVTWAQGQTDQKLIKAILSSPLHQVRAAAVRVLRHDFRKIPGYTNLFLKAAGDTHPRVRMEAAVAASWIPQDEGALIVAETLKHPIEKWMHTTLMTATRFLDKAMQNAAASGKIDLAKNPVARDVISGKLKITPVKKRVNVPVTNLTKANTDLFNLGKEIYGRDAHCSTCHQPDGKGLENIYPPLTQNAWVTQDEERLIKLTLKGLWGTLKLKGKTYDHTRGVPPMTGFGGILNDKEVAAVLTYVRNSFGNQAPAVQPETVARVRKQTENRQNFYMVDELLQEHPFPGAKKKSKTVPKKPSTTRNVDFGQQHPGHGTVSFKKWPEKGLLKLPRPMPNITRAYFADDAGRRPLTTGYNKNATEITLQLPEKETASRKITVETAENSSTFADGRVVFSALDSSVKGKTAKLETRPGNHYIGYWNNTRDAVIWKGKNIPAGRYKVELAYSLASNSPSKIAVTYGPHSIYDTIPSTGSWCRYTAATLGVLEIGETDRATLRVNGFKRKGAVMNLKAVTFRPVGKE